MLFTVDTLTMKLRHEEMLRQAAKDRLADEAARVNGTGTNGVAKLLSRMANLLARSARTETPRHQPSLANVK